MPPRTRIKRLPRPASTQTPEREYLRFLLKYHFAFADIIRNGLARLLPSLQSVVGRELPAGMRADSMTPHMDARNIEKSLDQLFADTEEALMSRFPDSILQRWSKAMVGHVNKLSKKNIAKTAATAGAEIGPLLHDNGLHPFFQNVVDENVGLIRSVASGRMPTLKNALVAAITSDQSNKTITQILQKQFGMSKNHAKLIAVDQVNKLNGSLQQYRQRSLGGKRYVWRTVEDGAVRTDHRKLDGRTFSWNNPPVTDTRTGARNHPGQDFRCRCYPEMVLEDVLE